MTEVSLIIGYMATTTSVVAFGSQFYFTIKTKTTAGLSLQRSVLDTLSLVLWVLYATRVEDIPLLIATTTELFLSILVCGLIVRQRRIGYAIKDFTPPATPPFLSEDALSITIRPRANSV